MRAGKVEETPLDIYSYRIIVPIVSSSEGALMRRHGGREGMRRPRAGFASLPPGGPGQPSVPTTRDCPSVGWTRRGRRWAKACRIGLSQKPPGPASGSYGPGDRKAAMERREAPAFLARGARQDGRLVRHSVLYPLAFSARRKKEDGLPGAAQITRARTRALLEYGR